ncbi:MAG: hypothetical protein ACOYYS_17710 [Chloroflexota bacterium]
MTPNPFEPHGLEAAIFSAVALMLAIKLLFWLVVSAHVLKTGRMPGLVHKLYLGRRPRPPLQVQAQKHEHEHRHRHEEHVYIHVE